MSSSTSSLSTLPPGPKLFSRPRIILYRFLDVIKEKHNLAVEFVLYMSENLSTFLDNHWNSTELCQLITTMRQESFAESEQNDIVPVIFDIPQQVQMIKDSVVLYVMFKCQREHQQLDIGHHSKSIQTLVHWVVLEGMITGRFRIAIQPSYVESFQYWRNVGVPQMIFSSVTHKLWSDSNRLISKTDHGDLNEYFHFLDMPMNTRKKETYVMLAQSFHIASTELLLVTFSETEARKAARAGYKVAKIRQHNQPMVTNPNITLVNNITEIRMAYDSKG